MEVDGILEQNIQTRENTTPKVFTNVNIYAGDQFYAPALGKIRNLRVRTKNV